MDDATKGIMGLVLWLLAGFAVTQVGTLVLSQATQKPQSMPAGHAEPHQFLASAFR